MENKVKNKNGMRILLILYLLIIILLITQRFAYIDLQKENNGLKEKNEKLEKNQKPATELYNESNKPCVGC